MSYDLEKEFKKFAGRELQQLDESDPLTLEMEEFAKDKGLDLLVIWGEAVTSDLRDDRINAFVRQNNQGKWCVDHFSMY